METSRSASREYVPFDDQFATSSYNNLNHLDFSKLQQFEDFGEDFTDSTQIDNPAPVTTQQQVVPSVQSLPSHQQPSTSISTRINLATSSTFAAAYALQLQHQQRANANTNTPSYLSTGHHQTTIEPKLIDIAQMQMVPHGQNNDQGYFDITPFISLSQEKAAKQLGLPKSTLSKRWREATCNRKWPYRQLCKLDREIKTLVHNIHSHAGEDIGPQLQASLASLIKQRQEEARIVYIKNITPHEKIVTNSLSTSDSTDSTSSTSSISLSSTSSTSSNSSISTTNSASEIESLKYKYFGGNIK